MNNMATLHSDPRGCVVIAAFREQGRIGAVVRQVRNCIDPVIVVDDGSPDATADEAAAAGAVVLRHASNRGKGAALETGLDHARTLSPAYVIVMDGDGQHDPADLPAFIAHFYRTNAPVILGNRMDRCETMPKHRRDTNRFMSRLLSRKMGQDVPDTQCGFRLFSAEVLPSVFYRTRGFAADSEILLRLAARGFRIDSVPIRVIYGNEHSKIRPVRDTIRFFWMLWRFRPD